MALIAQDIKVKLGGTQILHGVDFSAVPGEITAIVGPNGSGKTTLLKALTGEVAYDGRVILNGQDIARASAKTLAVQRAVLPQATNLAFPFTVLEVVRLGLTAGLSDTTLDHSDKLPMEALRKVGLTGFEGRFYQELSGGEKQRVQLARVLVQIWQPVLNGQPRWLFLDEPVSALDIGHQLVVMGLAKQYAEAGGGVVAVMHDLNLTAMFADQVALIDGGHVKQFGTPTNVFTNSHLSAAYGCGLNINMPPATDIPWLLPHTATVS